jgi:hypothetical protein
MITSVRIPATVLIAVLLLTAGGTLRADRHPRLPLGSAALAETRTELVSEAVGHRTSLILPRLSGRHADIDALTTAVSAIADDGARRTVDGLNRTPGLIRGCGGSGDTPTDAPKHDFTCTDAGELILFRPVFGSTTEAGAGVEAVLAANGTVTQIRPVRGGTIPVGGAVVAGTGDGSAWLMAHARVGTVVEISTRVLTEHGRRLKPEDDEERSRQGATTVPPSRTVMANGWKTAAFDALIV